MPVPSVAAAIARRIWASSSAVASSDSRPGSRTGPAATPGTKSACATSTCSTPGSRTAQRSAASEWASGLVVAARLVDPDRHPPHRDAQLAAHHHDRVVGVVDDVVGGRAEEQRHLARAAVADDDDDVGPELLGRLDQRLAGRAGHHATVEPRVVEVAERPGDEVARHRLGLGRDRRWRRPRGRSRPAGRWRAARRSSRPRSPPRAPTRGRHERAPSRPARRGTWSSARPWQPGRSVVQRVTSCSRRPDSRRLAPATVAALERASRSRRSEGSGLRWELPCVHVRPARSSACWRSRSARRPPSCWGGGPGIGGGLQLRRHRRGAGSAPGARR